MDKQKLTDLGEFYATQRISRGYTQDHVATKGLSKSQISNFENGKHMLSASSLLLAIRGINMSANEFFYALNNYHASTIQVLTARLIKIQESEDVAGARRLLLKTPKSSHDALQNVMIKEMTGQNLVKLREVNLVGNYLTSIDEWTEFELAIFGFCIEILDVGDVYWLAKEMLERTVFYSELVLNQHIIRRISLHVFAYMIVHDELAYAHYFSHQLKILMHERWLTDWVRYKFLKNLLAFKLTSAPQLVDDMAASIDCLMMLDAKKIRLL
ncbi:hypothetical protein GYQ39_05825 [Lactococcus piscium]|uniref:Positive transcriptional regulator, MutR family n=1 Tax=Pseudolactococcus piscium MKFS47 TaxID=297352 RepID=A0A0D6DXM2_9LACT|nr:MULTISPECIES: Rgg/GadR/MutR family transcriptional regulator [Lactococcus]MCJ2000446.1 hypothetical protein [Lactococcus carnosus]CEN28246.1 Positive transcriptional regulator, MutR family [Lactococcus piscium MKFS47]